MNPLDYLGKDLSPAPTGPSVVYQAHIENIGWQSVKLNGQIAGTTCQGLRLEALTVRLENTIAQLKIEAHVQDYGWTAVRNNGEVVGTIGLNKRVEAIRLWSDKHKIMYRTHLQEIGWSNWKTNGEVSGTVGQNRAIEAIEIKLS